MLKILGWPPQEKGAGDVGFGEIGIDLKSALAMKFGLFEPYARWIEFEMARGADNGKRGMSEGEGGIASDGGVEMARGARDGCLE